MRHGACNGTAAHPRGLQRQSKTAKFACTLGRAKQKLGNIFGNWRNYFEIKFLVALPPTTPTLLSLPPSSNPPSCSSCSVSCLLYCCCHCCWHQLFMTSNARIDRSFNGAPSPSYLPPPSFSSKRNETRELSLNVIKNVVELIYECSLHSSAKFVLDPSR